MIGAVELAVKAVRLGCNFGANCHVDVAQVLANFKQGFIFQICS
tara:strand:+ start:194 stop:325 length:132 start_codon:yes stop_codon:yes gene_type:complete